MFAFIYLGTNFMKGEGGGGRGDGGFVITCIATITTNGFIEKEDRTW
jgi:hypothetical protein